MTIARRLKKFLVWFAGLAFRDFWRKTIALFFSLIVYFTVLHKAGKEEIVRDVPVSLTVPAALVSMDETPPKVSLRIRASDRNISRISPTEFHIDIKIEERKFTPGAPYTVKITPQDIKTPYGVDVVKTDPAELLINLERNISKNVLVKPKLSPPSMLPDGYIIGGVKVNPPEVRVTGPASIVDKLDFVSTVTIPLDKSAYENFEYTASVVPGGNLVKSSPQKVSAHIEIVKEEVSSIFRSIPIRILEAAQGGGGAMTAEFLSAPNVDVSVSGPKGKIQAMKPELIKAYIDLGSIEQPGVYNVDVGCWTGVPGVEVKSVYPQKVQIKLTKSADGAKTAK
jgi:YbbR domain-containing protein